MFRTRSRIAVAIVALLAVAAAACSGQTTSDIIFTAEAESKIANADATAAAVAEVMAQGGLVQSGETGTGGQGGLAGELRATAEAVETATGGSGDAVTSLTPTPSGSDILEIPDGEALTGEVVVNILNIGVFDPRVIKIKVGTTVKWQNTERTNHKSTSEPGQAEQWDSGNLARLVTDKENRSYSHTFTIPGRYTYRSTVAGESPDVAVVFVVE